jgi:hypothetical protein
MNQRIFLERYIDDRKKQDDDERAQQNSVKPEYVQAAQNRKENQ